MNLFNRILIVLELLITFVGSLVLIAVILIFKGQVKPALDNALTSVLGPTFSPAQLLCVGLLALVVAFSFLMMILELQRPGSARLRVESVQGAEVSITAEAIIRRLEYEIESIADIIRARANVSTAGNNKVVNVAVDLLISPEADIATKTQEVSGVARRVIEDRLGLKVGKIQVKVDHVKMPVTPLPKKT